jgi:transcriptional regulator GlxA family with amidase domain
MTTPRHSEEGTPPRRNVAILLFDGVEVLDFAGPFEVFSVAGRRDDLDPFNVYTVAETGRPILARNELSVNPRYTIDNCPAPDIVVVPGGFGTRREIDNPTIIEWIRRVSAASEITFSVCTGALLLGKAGLLDGQRATTHFAAFLELAAAAPGAALAVREKVVDNGRIVTSAGISAGIEAALHLVGRLIGQAHAVETARYMEYDWRP